MREVPGVIGVKQSAGDLKLLADLLIAAPARGRIFSAVDALLYPSFALGRTARGILAAAPRACVELWEAVRRGDHAARTICTGAAAALERHGATTCRPAPTCPDPPGLPGGPPRRRCRRVARPAARDHGALDGLSAAARPPNRRLAERPMLEFVHDALPGRGVFGAGSLERLPDEVARLGARARSW